ncbi:DUF6244 family protein, partial [Micromonospora zhanjiangensis]
GGSPQDTIDGLTPVRSAVDEARDAAAGIGAEVGQAQQLVTVVLQGGQPGPMLSALDNIKQIMAQLVQRAVTARQHADAAVAEARQLGSAGN